MKMNIGDSYPKSFHAKQYDVISVVICGVEDNCDEILRCQKMLKVMMIIERMEIIDVDDNADDVDDVMMMMTMTMAMSAVLIPCCATQWCIVKTTQRLNSGFFSKTPKNMLLM